MASSATRRVQGLFVLALGIIVLFSLPRSRTFIGQVTSGDPYCNGLVAYWKLDEKAGNIAKDSVSCQNAIVHTTNPAADWKNASMAPNTGLNTGFIHIGGGEGIETPVNTSSTFTWMAWIRVAPVTRTFDIVPGTVAYLMLFHFDRGQTPFSILGSTQNFPSMRLAVRGHTGKTNEIALYNSEGYTDGTLRHALPNDHTWIHIALVRKGDAIANGGYAFYINGVNQYSNTGYNSGKIYKVGQETFLAPVHYDGRVWIGSRSGVNESFYGDIDDVRFYNRPLTDSEIYGIAKEGKGYDLSCASGCVASSSSSTSSSSSSALCCNLGATPPACQP